jgi:hypothetical protein
LLNTGKIQDTVRSTRLGRDLDRRAAPPIVALSQLGFVWPTGPFGKTTANKKPGAVSRPGIVAYSWMLCFSYEIR